MESRSTQTMHHNEILAKIFIKTCGSDEPLKKLLIAGDNVDCWMEIQHGKGPWANPVTGIVPLGTTLTMVIGINDKQGKENILIMKTCKT